MSGRGANWVCGVVVERWGRRGLEEDQGRRLRRSLQEEEGALAENLAQGAVCGVALGSARRLRLAERAVLGSSNAVPQCGLRQVSVVRDVGEDPRRRQQDFQSQRQSEEHHHKCVASHSAHCQLAYV